MAIVKLETVYVRLVEDAHNGDLVDIQTRCYDCYAHERINDTAHADDYRAALPGEVSEGYSTHCEKCGKLLVSYILDGGECDECGAPIPPMPESFPDANAYHAETCFFYAPGVTLEAPSVAPGDPSALATPFPGFIPANDIEARYVAEGGDPRNLDVELQCFDVKAVAEIMRAALNRSDALWNALPEDQTLGNALIVAALQELVRNPERIAN